MSCLTSNCVAAIDYKEIVELPTPPVGAPISRKLAKWLIAGYILSIYSTLSLMPLVEGWFCDLLGRKLFYQLVNLGLVAGALSVMALLLRRFKWRAFMLAIPLGAIGYLATLLNNPSERVHFMEYALLGAMLLYTVERPGWRFYLFGFGFVTLAGAADETIQWWLPNRYGDIKDVAIDAVGGALGLWLGRFLIRNQPPTT